MQISSKRVVFCYLMAVILLLICVLRVFVVMKNEKYSTASANPVRKTIELNQSRGTIYDCNGEKITNSKKVYYAVIFNNPLAISKLYNRFSGSEIEKITEEIAKKGYSVQRVSGPIEGEGIYCIEATLNYDDSLIAKHLIGYVDQKGNGVSGLQASFNDLLKGNGKNTLTFTISGQGQVLTGEGVEFRYDYQTENCGVKITIDKKLQQITEQSAMAIDCGAVLVTEIKTGKIRAAVSRPDYKPSNISTAIKGENNPLFNRLLTTYNIGSVFKPFVSAAGYEQGITFETNCVGYTDVDGLTFSCHNLGGHGPVNIEEALKFSCNSYFYNYITLVGAKKVFEIAKKAGFEASVYLADGIVSARGSLGRVAAENLTDRALANISIGQGELMLSPLAITNMYMAIGKDGSYRPLSLVEGVMKNGKMIEQTLNTADVRVMTKTTAKKLRDALKTVLDEDGTGKSARPEHTTAAGKTGTAQTGIEKDGKRVTNSWFCGFFPADNPKYAVTVVAENFPSGCGSIFKAIADRITRYEEGQYS